MRIIICCLTVLFAIGCSVSKSGFKTDKLLEEKLNNTLSASAEQYKLIMAKLDQNSLPRTFENGELKTTKPSGWVSGFYTSTLYYLYEFGKDETLLAEARRSMQLLEQEQFNTQTHDLGFMMFCSYGNANRLFPHPAYDTVIINAARSLASRFSPVVGCIRSWNSEPSKFVVIVDNMMNLELLTYAFRKTGDSSFYKIAVTHANTTIKNHFREDNSSWHVINYDPATGAVQAKITHQGAADESAWARGQAWGLYGFTMLYRETGIHTYLEQAVKIADFILSHPNLPEDKIPYWDFDAPGIPNAFRDASAGAIMSSALLELSNYAGNDKRKTYFTAAETMLNSLSSKPYKTTGAEAGGFILQHGVGHLPAKSEVDVPLTYGDYYFVEAAMRYLGTLKIPEVQKK